MQLSAINLQWQHFISALNAWAARAYYTNARPIATQLVWLQSYVGHLAYLCVLPDIPGCLYNQALANAWTTGAGIKCLHCIELII